MNQLLHIPHPSLPDPGIFADVVFSDLCDVLGLAAGKAVVDYHHRREYPVCLRVSDDAYPVCGAVQRFREFLGTTEHYLDPFRITTLTATVEAAQRLDGFRVMPAALGCQQLFTQAHLHPGLFGIELQLHGELRHCPQVGDKAPYGLIEVTVHEDEIVTPELAEALEAYQHSATRTWDQVVESGLGPWAIANGVWRMAFEAEFTVERDRAEQLDESYRLECAKAGYWIE